MTETVTLSGGDWDRNSVGSALRANRGSRLRFDRCSFKEMDLSGLKLAGVLFNDCAFDGTTLEKADLSRTVWHRCRGPMANFDMCDLTEAMFEGGDYNNSTWNRARLSSASFFEVKLTGARFREAQALGLVLRHSILVNADVRGFSFRKQRIEALNFAGADLAGCDFSSADFVGGSLRDANLKGASFKGADLRNVELGPVQIGDLQQHFKGSILSIEQAATIVSALGINVV